MVNIEDAGLERYPDLVLSAFAITGDWGRAEQVVREVFARALGRRAVTPPERLWAQVTRLARRRTLVARLLRRRRDPYLPDAVLAYRGVVAHRLAGWSDAQIAAAAGTSEEAVAAALGAIRTATPAPEPARLLARLRRQRVRRKTLAGAAAAVLVVAVVVPALRESPPPAAEEHQVAFPPLPVPRERHIYWLDFADRDHGYALRFDCPTSSSSVGTSECVADMLATDDGERWTTRRVPRPERYGAELNGTLRVLGPREVVVDWQIDPNRALVDRIHTNDGGRHWSRVTIPGAVTATTPSIPDGSSILLACTVVAPDGNTCATRALGTLLSGSGDTALLATQPPLAEMFVSPWPLLRGDRWWVVGREPATGRWALAVSADAGRTWWTSPVDLASDPTEASWSVGAHGQTLYATALETTEDGQALTAVYRSDDGGRTWTRTWGPDGRPTMVGYFGTPVVEPDGTLLLDGFEHHVDATAPTLVTYVSEDRGVTFTAAASRDVGFLFWTRAGYLAWPANEDNTFQVSTDGLSWQPLTVR